MFKKAIVLFVLFLTVSVYTQNNEPSWEDIKSILTHSTDINQLVQKVTSMSGGYSVKGTVQNISTAFSNGDHTFYLSVYENGEVKYEEEIDGWFSERHKELMNSAILDGLKDDPKSKRQSIVLRSGAWMYEQKSDTENGQINIKIIYSKP